MTHNNSNNTPTLEQRIAIALADNTIVARTLAALIQETEQAIVEAEQTATTTQQQALDPILSPDPIKAREAAQFAEFAARRLRNVLPRLIAAHQQITTAERTQRWTAAADQLQARRDALVQDFAEQYPALIAQLVDLFERTRAMDAEVACINGAAPNTESRRIQSIAATHILANTKLLDLTGKHQVWPPPPPPININTIVPHLGGGPNWYADLAERDRERRAEGQRVANYYANQAQAREEREAAEAKAARARNGGAP